jgi:signal transduction histidine kinase
VVLSRGEIRRASAGEILIRQGDPGDSLFVVLRGALSVWVTDTSGERLDLSTVSPGGYVGEIALLDGGPRSASVACAQACDLFVLRRPVFLRLLQATPDLLSVVLQNLTASVRGSTERAMREQLERRTLRAEMDLTRHRALTEMVAGIAHELNTPLGIVRTAANLLRNRVAAGMLEDVDEATTLIERNIERAHRLVEDFKALFVSQISDTRLELDLLSVVEEVVELFSISARKAGLRVVVHGGETSATGRKTWLGYRGRLSQVLLNLLTNVEHYAYPDGAGGLVEVNIDADSTGLDGFVLTVRNYGRGIAAEDLPRVFDPFFTTGRARGGSGLGLAIVQSLVQDGLGGTIRIASQPDEGVTVIITLPREAPG